jgi:hypothetical protein
VELYAALKAPLFHGGACIGGSGIKIKIKVKGSIKIKVFIRPNPLQESLPFCLCFRILFGIRR